MNHLINPHSGASYLVLGPAFDRKDLWLARDQATQKLVLLQKFPHPQPRLPYLLTLKHECLPRVFDWWVEQAATFVILERVQGPEMDPLGSALFSADSKSRLRAMVSSLNRWGWQVPCSSALCLDSQGKLRLRWLPGDGSENCQRVA